ncbi:MAG: sulfatase-like hydrolase/transferase [Planctomycetes bacterium]|nr:sulfatase-like hydrolase/transferase [Planctomycetota bacterium]
MRARLLLSLASALALVSLPACFLFHGGKEANILLVVVESLRYDAISNASGAARTPNLHALVADGTAFRSCFSHSPSTQPALASLLSSRLPHEHGLMHNGDELSEGVALLPEWLGKRGYQTFAAFGLASSAPARRGHGLDRGFGRVVTFPHELADASDVLDSFDAFLDGAVKKRPWFGMLQFTETRQPFDAGEDDRVEASVIRDGEEPETISIGDSCFWERTASLPPGRTRFTIHGDVPMRILRFGAKSGARQLHVVFERGAAIEPGKDFVISVENPDADPLTCELEGWFHDAPSLAASRKRYRHEIEAVDDAIGRLVEDLKARGIYEQTVIVLTSDHGLALGEHDALGRGDALFDEFLHVPLLIKPLKDDSRAPELALSVSDVTRLADVVPTLLDLSDVSPMPGAGGGTLLEHRRRELIAETHTGESAGSVFALRDERFKLLLGSQTNRFSMYDLRSDTLEQEDVFPLQGQNKPEWQRRLGALVGGVHAPRPHPDTRFEALGY